MERALTQTSTFDSTQLETIFSDYQPHHELNLKTKHFSLKTARTLEDLYQIFSLRQEIFLPNNKEQISEYDQFDPKSDHLMIIDNKSEKLIGTYRILHRDWSSRFYSESEFIIDEFLQKEDNIIELGRACVREESRGGPAIKLLWKGISSYIEEYKPRFLIGCSSLPYPGQEAVTSLYQYLKENNAVSEEYSIKVTAKYFCPLGQQRTEQIDVGRLIPSLLKAYLKAGAHVYGSPAWDKEFSTVDFFTILDLNKMNPFFRKYFLGEEHDESDKGNL